MPSFIFVVRSPRLVANKVSVIASGVSLLTVASVSRTVPSEQCNALLCAMLAHKFKYREPNGKIKSTDKPVLILVVRRKQPQLNTSTLFCYGSFFNMILFIVPFAKINRLICHHIIDIFIILILLHFFIIISLIIVLLRKIPWLLRP